MLKIAIQKSGRLYEDSISLLKECGIDLHNGGGQLKATAYNFPLQAYFLRHDDIPQYIEDGIADIGIIGENVYLEKGCEMDVLRKLGFGRCRLSIAVPKNDVYNGIKDLEGKRIATTYPALLKRYLEKSGVHCEIHTISGSVEIAPGIGLAEAVCDLVSTGSTLFTNGLKEVEVVLPSEAVFVGNRQAVSEKQDLLNKLLLRMDAVKKARNSKYILLNAPNNQLEKIIEILPGMKSPTVVPLAEAGWSSVHSVVDEDVFWDVIEQLKDLKAEGILVIPIEKMIL